MSSLLDRCSAFVRGFTRRGEEGARISSERFLPGIGPITVAHVVNCVGAMCPRPQLLIRKYVEQSLDGEVIEVVSDNPALAESFPWLAEALFCRHLATIRSPECWRLYLSKGIGGEAAATQISSEARN